MQTLLQDLRYGARTLLKNPGFTVVAVITLALGIGANTAIFTVVDAALLRALPYKNPEGLVQLWETRQIGELKQLDASYPDYVDWGRPTEIIDGICGYTGWGGSFTMTDATARNAQPERIEGARVTASFFSVLGVETALGRSFLPEEDRPGAAPTAVLSYGLWQRRFGADPNIVGQRLTLDGGAYTVIGVLPQGFQFAPMGQAELWVPLRPSPAQLSKRYMHWLDVIVRLKPGVSLEQAQARLGAVAAGVARENPDSHTGAGMRIVPLHDQVVGPLRPLLLVLLGAIGFVLLIACANVASLMLVRANARRREIGIRQALGATRRRLARQLISESLLLTFAGGILGLLVAQWGIELLIAAIPAAQLDAMPYLRGPHMQGLTINARVFLFTGALSALTGVIFGLAPAWQASKLDLQASLSQGTASVGPVRQRLRSALAVSEIALALVLLVGAGLMIKSTLRLLEVKMGFNPERLITMQSELPSARYSDDDRARAFHQQLLARVGSIPGVVGAATVNWLPMLPGPADLVTVEGQAPPPPGTEPKSNTRAVSSSYFSTMGITLLKGRVFTERDDASAPGVVIVNHTLAARLFGKEEALGRRIGFGAKPFEIIGVVDDERVGALDEESAPVAYRPYLQEPWTRLALVARTNAEPQTVIDAVRNETRALDPTLAFYAAMTMERLIADTPSTFLRRYPAIILACFAAIALILAAIGIYGVIAYSVSQRTREIGLRMALGARRGDVLRLVFRQGASITLAGVCVGLAGSFALTRLMQGMLFGVTATDPLTFTGVALSLAVVALLACWVPARRATRIDPMIALRCDG